MAVTMDVAGQTWVAEQAVIIVREEGAGSLRDAPGGFPSWSPANPRFLRISEQLKDFIDFSDASLAPSEIHDIIRGLFSFQELGSQERGLTYRPGDRVEVEIRALDGTIHVTRGLVFERDTTAPNLLGGARVLTTSADGNRFVELRDGERGGLVRITKLIRPACT